MVSFRKIDYNRKREESFLSYLTVAAKPTPLPTSSPYQEPQLFIAGKGKKKRNKTENIRGHPEILMPSGIPIGKAGSTWHYLPSPRFAAQNAGLQREPLLVVVPFCYKNISRSFSEKLTTHLALQK